MKAALLLVLSLSLALSPSLAPSTTGVRANAGTLSTVAASADAFDDAKALAAKKRWDDVAALLSEFHRRGAGTAESHALYGEALGKLKRSDEAAHHLAQALQRMEEDGAAGSKEYRAVKAELVKIDPLTTSRDAYFRNLVQALFGSASSLFEAGHHERALDLLERIEPFAAACAESDRAKLAALLAEARAKFAEVDLDQAGGGVDVQEARPLVESESEHYVVSANLELEVAELVGRTMDDIFQNYIAVYFGGETRGVSDRKATIRIFADHAAMMEEWDDPTRSVGGWWSPGEWRVVCYDTRSDAGTLDQMLETLFHEASHQFMTMRAKGGDAPSWLNEGTASFFEGATAMSDGRVLWPDAAPMRLGALAAMLREKKGPSVRQVVEYDEPSSYPGEYYPFGWGLVYFLQQWEDPATLDYAWRPYYQRYIDHITTRGGPSMGAFEELILAPGNPGGFTSFDEFATAWEKWILETVFPLHFGPDRRERRWAEARRYLAAADAAAAESKKGAVSEEELCLRALGHTEKLRASDDPEHPDVELYKLRIDLFERLGRPGTAAASAEELLGLVGAGKVALDETEVQALDERMAKLDRGNYPLRSLRTRVKDLKRGAAELLARYERARSPRILRSWTFAREAAAALDDEGELLAAAERLRVTAREAGLVPSRVVAVEGERWASVLSSSPQDLERTPGRLAAARAGVHAGEICLDVEVEGEYELRATLQREGELFKSTLHGLVISGTPSGDWTVVAVDKIGRLVIRKIEKRGGGTRARNAAMELLQPPLQPDEKPEIAVRVLPDGRLRVTVGDREPVRIELEEPLPERAYAGYYVKDGKIVLTDFVAEIFP